MSSTINDTKDQFQAYQSLDDASYQQRVAEISSDRYDVEKQAILSRLDSFDMINEGGSDVATKYNLFTQLYIDELVRFKDMVLFVKGELTIGLEDQNLADSQRQILENALEYLETDSQCTIGGMCSSGLNCGEEPSMKDQYIAGTEYLVNNFEAGALTMFMNAHSTFATTLENFDKLDDLQSFYNGYLSVYNNAIQTLDSMMQSSAQFDTAFMSAMDELCASFGMENQTPSATSVLQHYRSAMASSANAMAQRATKKAKSCKMNGYVWWIIVFILILMLVGAAWMCRKRR